ncbi:ribosome maturation factor RimM [Radiobacillus sp. PE A8.2]|uniref:ribosome maturation factor RimM n=1 Tax=Radiobacillus sp. PE A8.2 TaxID=3380349 RepID=UPI003890297A
MDDKFFNVGKIVNTHGIKGEVKVIRITDFDERFQVGQQLYWFKNEQEQPVSLVVDGYRKHKQFDLLHFKNYDNINEVEKLRDGMLKVTEDQLTPLAEGEYYYHEIIGCAVVTTDDTYLGEIKEVLSPGANDVWVVKRDGQKDLLIPYIDDIVKQVNISDKQVIVEPMEGLLD